MSNYLIKSFASSDIVFGILSGPRLILSNKTSRFLKLDLLKLLNYNKEVYQQSIRKVKLLEGTSQQF